MVQPSIVEKRERELTQIQEEFPMQSEQTVSPRGRGRWKLGCLGMMVLALVAAYQLSFIYGAREAKQSSVGTALIFAESLQSNSLRQAKSLAARELWPALEDWATEHEKVGCRFSLESTGFASTIPTEDEKPGVREHVEVIIRSPCPRASNEWYCLNVHDIVLEHRDSGWEVVAWGNVEERLAPGYCDDF